MHGIIRPVKNRYSYPLEIIRSAILKLEDCTSWQQQYCIKDFLPYCLKHIDDIYLIPLNRDYKPIGLHTGDWVDYKNFPFLYLKKEDVKTENLIDQSPTFFFYNDSTSPKRSKQKKEIYIEKVINSLNIICI